MYNDIITHNTSYPTMTYNNVYQFKKRIIYILTQNNALYQKMK